MSTQPILTQIPRYPSPILPKKFLKLLWLRTRSNQNISDVFLIDTVMTTYPTTIANKFNTFFADIGLRLSETVNNTHTALFSDYLLHPSMYDFTFELITEEVTTMKILNNLKPKPSCGYDGICLSLKSANQ